jgi:hypothetical protein
MSEEWWIDWAHSVTKERPSAQDYSFFAAEHFLFWSLHDFLLFLLCDSLYNGPWFQYRIRKKLEERKMKFTFSILVARAVSNTAENSFLFFTLFAPVRLTCEPLSRSSAWWIFVVQRNVKFSSSNPDVTCILCVLVRRQICASLERLIVLYTAIKAMSSKIQVLHPDVYATGIVPIKQHYFFSYRNETFHLWFHPFRTTEEEKQMQVEWWGYNYDYNQQFGTKKLRNLEKGSSFY